MVTPTHGRMRVAVTGGSGYVGAVLIPILRSRGYDVVMIDLIPPTPNANPGAADAGQAGDLEVILADIRDAPAMRTALAGVDAIIHLAAVVGYPACDADPDSALSINEAGTFTVFSAAPSEARVVFMSTASIYGRFIGASCTEASPIQPLSLYAKTKASADSRALDLGFVALRPGTAFGGSPRFRSDLIIHDFILRGIRAERLELFEPHAIRAFIHVTDLARSAIHAIETYADMQGQAFNVAGPDAAITKLELAERIKAKTALDLVVNDDRSDPDGRNYWIDSSCLEATGFDLPGRFDTRLDETVRWIEEHHPVQTGA